MYVKTRTLASHLNRKDVGGSDVFSERSYDPPATKTTVAWKPGASRDKMRKYQGRKRLGFMVDCAHLPGWFETERTGKILTDD